MAKPPNVIAFRPSAPKHRRATFNPAARPIVPFDLDGSAARKLARRRNPKPAVGSATQEQAGQGIGPDETISTPGFPHHWDVVIMREIRELPDTPGQYASKSERKVAESKAMAAQRRVMDTFATKYLELKKRCLELEAENRRLSKPCSSVSRKS